MEYKIRPATRAQVDTAVEWASKEGWNPGLYDADAFYASDPKGFFIGFLGDVPISSISAIKYDDLFGFIGFYIVRPEFRGKGFGYRIWKEAMNYLDGYNIGLDGVLNQQATYKLSGFDLAYRNIRFEGKGMDEEVTDPSITPLADIPFSDLLSYDEKIFPVTRRNFLRLWITQPEALAIGYKKDGVLSGYGMVRKCGTGYKIGPLFADTPSIADTLFMRMRSFVGGGSSLFIDVPEVHSEGMELVKRHTMTAMFETARMYRGTAPVVPMDKIFGVTTFELG